MDDHIVVISDLHLGAPSSLLKLPAVRQRLRDTLKGLGQVDILILLGDVLDLTRAPQTTAWDDAIWLFSDIFADDVTSLRKAQVYYVPGNHDHHIWMMLAEQRDVILPLEAALLPRKPGVVTEAVLSPLKLATGEFNPGKPTFVHGLFPRAVRNRVHICYPFMKGQCRGGVLLFHHGHYFDRRITPLAGRIAREHKSDIVKVEEYSSLFLESIFYLASVGRGMREVTLGAYWHYKRIVGEFNRLFGRLGLPSSSGWGRERVGGLPRQYIADMIRDLFEMESYTLVFGHTHKFAEFHDEALTVAMYNTGGWIVEENDDEVSPGVLQIVDGNIRWIPCPAQEDEIRQARARAGNTKPVGRLSRWIRWMPGGLPSASRR